jgi:hypothetical protein
MIKLNARGLQVASLALKFNGALGRRNGPSESKEYSAIGIN